MNNEDDDTTGYKEEEEGAAWALALIRILAGQFFNTSLIRFSCDKRLGNKANCIEDEDRDEQLNRMWKLRA